MAPKGVCVLKSEKVNGVVKFEQEVRSHDLVLVNDHIIFPLEM